MKKLALIVSVVTATLFSFGVKASVDFSGVTALADRLGGTALTSKVSFTEWEGQSGDKAQIIPGDGAFTIEATSVHAASLALGTYLRDVAKGHISWCGKRMPTDWALPTATIDVAPRYPHAMAYNYCTLSYTMAYWSKEAWQTEIDRLALSGYTTALCMAGVQKIWKLTMEELSYTKQQQQDFIVDDAQQAWWLMGNLQAIGNGTEAGHYPIVSDEEIETDADIGRFIVKQMRAVGIEPVLQAFIGLVPSTTTKAQIVTYLNNHPDVCAKYGITDTSAAVNIFVNGYYNEGHKNPDLIDPNCTAFQVYSDIWNKNLKAVYGMTDAKDNPKYLGGDLFHESAPPSTMTYDEQVNCTKFIQKYQQDAFPGVVWVLQNWQKAPVQNLRDGLDPRYTIVQRLDQSMNATDARTASYVNNTTHEAIPWVWVEVMNFGGNTGMHGAFTRFRSVGNLGGNATFKGYGLLSEGLETNPVSYDMYHWAMVQSNQAAQNIDGNELEPWLEAYRLRRYGYTDDNLKAAQTILANTVWNCLLDQQGTMESVFCAKPGYNVLKVSEWGPTTGTPYDRFELVAAARLILASAKAHPELLNLETFRYDFVEIFQQLLADKAREILPDCEGSKVLRDEFRRMLELVDAILACSDEWRLDKKEARVLGKAPTTGPAAYRRMITTWTPGKRHKTQLSNYAHRSYAGLMKHYCAAKWNAFFDVTEGTKTLAEYNTLSDTLDENFPTMVLEPTPTDGNPVELAEEILLIVDPPAYHWNGAVGNGKWDVGENWIFNSFPATWVENNNAVVTTESGLEISADAAVSVVDLEIKKGTPTAYSDRPGSDKTTVIKTTPVTVFKNHQIAELANWEFFGKMGGGGWFGSPVARIQDATACNVKAETTDGVVSAVTAQFQCIDDGWLKVVNIKFTQSGADIVAVATAVYGQAGVKLGTVLTKSVNTSPTIDAYPIYNIFARDPVPTSVKLDAKIKVSGVLTVGDTFALSSLAQINEAEGLVINGGTLDLSEIASGALAVPTLTLEADGAIVVPNGLTLSVGEFKYKKGTLQIRGANGTLAAGQVFLPRTALANTVYVGPNGEVQTLVMAMNGSFKSALQPMETVDWISSTAKKTSLKDVTLDDLLTYEYTGTMSGKWVTEANRGMAARGYQIAKDGDSVVFYMQAKDPGDSNTKSLKITLTIGADGYVYAKGSDGGYLSGDHCGEVIEKTNNYVPTGDTEDGYGVKTLNATPAVAQVADTKSNYASIVAAVTAAKATTSKELSVIADTAYGTSRGLTGGVKLTIEPGAALTSTIGDGIDWGGTAEVIVKGVLDLAKTRWTFSNNNTLTLYTGCEVIGAGDGSNGACAVEIHGNEHTIAVHQGSGEKAIVKSTIGLSNSVIFDVDDNAVCEIAKTSGGNYGAAARTITKTGLGELVIADTIYANATIKTGAAASGKISRTMKNGETITVTKGAGEVVLTFLPPNYDCKVVETVEGSVHTFACVAKDYRYRVTDPGYISVNMPGTNYETLAEALEAGKTLKEANPGEAVNIWAISQEVVDQVEADLKAWNAAHGTSMEVFGDGAGVVIKNWYVVPRLYYTSAAVEWKIDTKVSNTKNGEATVTTKAGDIVTFDKGSEFGPIYIHGKPAEKVPVAGFEVLSGTLKVGYEGSNASIPEGWVVTVADGATVQFDNWANGQAVKVMNATFNGEGTVTFGSTITSSSAVTFGTVKGDATITIPSGVTVTVTGSIKNPIAGAGTIKISGEQQLKFVSDATVKVLYENAQADGYYMNTTTVQNPDGTVTRAYGPVAATDIQAFDTSWTYYFTGSTDAWGTIANWSKVEGKTLVPLTGTKLPATTGSNMWEPILVNGNLMTVEPDEDGYKHVAVSSLEGWGFRIGAVNGAAVDIASMVKMQCDSSCLTTIRVDETSKVTISAVAGNNGTDAYYYIAAEDGLVLPRTMSNNGKYYLTGNGSVKYNGNFDSGNHTLKYAEIVIGTGDYKAYKTKKLIALKSGATNTASFTIDEGAVVDSSSAEGVTLTKKETALAADDPVGTYYLRKVDDGIYLDYVAKSETRPLLVWDTTKYDLTASSQVFIEGTTIKVVPTKDDTIVFNQNFTELGKQHFFIQHNTTTMKPLSACRNLLVKDGVTLHVGFANTSCNIPDDMNIVLEGSAKLVLTVWGNETTKAIKIGSNSFITGGSVEIDTVRATALETGDLDGKTTLVIPQDFIVTAKGDVNVTLSGSGTLKAANLGTIHADANWMGTVDASNVSTHGMMGQTIVGVKTTNNPDGTKTIEIVECANEAIMTSGGNLSGGTYVDPLGNELTWSQIQAMTFKPKIILNNNYGIHYFGDTAGYNFAVRETDIYSMITGGSLAFGASDIEVQSGTLHLITSEGLRNGSGWNPNVLKLADTYIVVGDSGHVEFTGTTATSPIEIQSDKTLTLGGNLNNVSFSNIRFNSPNGKLMLSGGIGTIELVGENIIKEVEIDRTMTVKLNGTASLKTTSAGLKIATDSTTQFVKATLAGGQYTYALADAKGAVSFNERENVYNFAAPQFAVANAAANSTVTVTIKNDQGATVLSQEATVGADGTVDILVGSAEDPQKPGLDVGKEYKYEVAVGGQTFEGHFFTMNLGTWFGAEATSGASAVTGGSWKGGEVPAVDTEAKVYKLEGDHAFTISEDKGTSRLAYVEEKITFTSAADVSDLATTALGTGAFGAFTLANDGVTDVWYAYIGGTWKPLYGVATVKGTEVALRVDINRGTSPKTISYVLNGTHLKDANDVTSFTLPEGAAFKEVDFKGTGKLARMEGVLPSTMVAKVGTTEYESLEAALEDANYGDPESAAGGDAPRYGVELLTSVLWAPAEGTYYITKGVHDIKVVNEKILTWNGEGTIAMVAVNDAPVEGFVAPVEGETTKPVLVAGAWLDALGTDGLTKKEIQDKLNAKPVETSELTNLEGYLLGVEADEVAETKVTTMGVQTDDPSTITLALDGITPRDRAETGITVKVQVMAADDPTTTFAEQGEAVEGASATIALPSTKVKYYRLKVIFK